MAPGIGGKPGAPGAGIWKFGGKPPGGGGKGTFPAGMLGRGGRLPGAPEAWGKGGGKGRPFAPGAVFYHVLVDWGVEWLEGVWVTYEGACPGHRLVLLVGGSRMEGVAVGLDVLEPHC